MYSIVCGLGNFDEVYWMIMVVFFELSFVKGERLVTLTLDLDDGLLSASLQKERLQLHTRLYGG